MHRSDVEFVLGDVRDVDVVNDLLSGCDGVIHLAAILGTQETIGRPKEVVEVNIKGSLNIFEVCKKYNMKGVYIGVGNHWMNNPYSITKTIAERFALMYNKEFGTKIAVIRGLNAYGPRQKQFPVRKIIPNLVIPAIKNKEITIYGSGKQIMDMIYVIDLAQILVRALLSEHGIYDRVIEAGMGEDTTINKLAEVVITMIDSSSKITHVKMRPGEVPDSVVKANTSTLMQMGWSQNEFTPLEKGVRETIEWYRENVKTVGSFSKRKG